MFVSAKQARQNKERPRTSKDDRRGENKNYRRPRYVPYPSVEKALQFESPRFEAQVPRENFRFLFTPFSTNFRVARKLRE